MKQCSKCGEEKPILEFDRNPQGRKGRRSHCKMCMKHMKAKWYSEKGKEWHAKNHRRIKYGYEGKVPALCAICRVYMVGGTTATGACCDHDHKTGRVRGFLCQPCNRALGQMNDSPLRFARATLYLLKYTFVNCLSKGWFK